MFDDVDTDGSGEADFEEFKTMMRRTMYGTRFTEKKTIEKAMRWMKVKKEIFMDDFCDILEKLDFRVTRDEALDMFEALEEENVITAAKMRKFLATDQIH